MVRRSASAPRRDLAENLSEELTGDAGAGVAGVRGAVKCGLAAGVAVRYGWYISLADRSADPGMP